MEANIEINDREYLIKLKKEDFSLEFLSSFMNRMLMEEPSFEGGSRGDIITRTFHYDAPTRFDHLDDK